MRAKPRFDWAAVVRRLPAVAVALVICLIFAWGILRSATVSALSRSFPDAAAKVAPDDPRVMAGQIEEELRTRMGVVGPKNKMKARKAIMRAPLLEAPFDLGGIDKLFIHDHKGAEPYIRHALARNARSRLARLLMLEIELRGGRAEAAAQDMTILSRLMPDVQKVFVPELARLAIDPETRPALRQALASDPAMLKGLLQYLAQKNEKPSIILELAGPNPPVVTEADAADWRKTLFNSMIAKGNLEGAHLLWARFAGVPASQTSGVYDGDFQKLPGLPPFNWSFSSSDIGAAEPDKRGGLQVEYYGRTAGELASQLLMLKPGSYRLSFHAEGAVDNLQHRLIWRIQCNRSNATILELPLSGITYSGKNVAANFTVPAQCNGQWLRLAGEPTEFPKIENVLIRNLKIQQAGAR